MTMLEMSDKFMAERSYPGNKLANIKNNSI